MARPRSTTSSLGALTAALWPQNRSRSRTTRPAGRLVDENIRVARATRSSAAVSAFHVERQEQRGVPRGTSKQRTLRGYTDTPGKPIRTQALLPKDLKPGERLLEATNRAHTQLGDLFLRPPAGGLARWLGHDQPPPYLQQRRCAFRSHCGRAEAAGQHQIGLRSPQWVSARVLSSSMADNHSVRQPQQGRSPGQKQSPPLIAFKKIDPGCRPRRGDNQAGDPTAATQVNHSAGMICAHSLYEPGCVLDMARYRPRA